MAHNPNESARRSQSADGAGDSGRPVDPPRILVVEDDSDFGVELTDYLESRGFATRWVESENGLANELVACPPDVLVLDQFLGRQDMLLRVPAIRQSFDKPILMLTANENQTDRILALEAGVDDFVLKSLGPREFVARLRALLRRCAPRTAAPLVTEEPVWRLDPRRREVCAPDGAILRLTQAEFETLRLLAASVGELVTRDVISASVLHRKFAPMDRSVDNIIFRLRKALDPHCEDGPSITTARGQGYVLHIAELSLPDSPPR
jgi:DNA-binding response OmpR family regulator